MSEFFKASCGMPGDSIGIGGGGAGSGGLPWYAAPPAFANSWLNNPSLHAFLTQYMSLPIPAAAAAVASLNTVNGLAGHHHHPIAGQLNLPQPNNHLLGLSAAVQTLPHNLTSKQQQQQNLTVDERDEDSTSSEDEIKRQSAQALRIKAEQVLRKVEK